MSSNTSSSLKRMQGSASYVDDEIMSSLPAPPPSKRAKQSRPGPTDAQASHRIQDAARSSQADEWSTPYDFEDTISHSSFLGYIQVYHTELTVPFKKYLLKALSLDIRKGNPDNIKLSIKAINKWFASYPRAGSASEYDSFIRLQKEWKALLAEIQKPLPPSSFSRSSKWVHQQNGAAFINCLRPPECSGLPLNLLHPLFAEFLARIEGPPPDGSDPKFILAEQVATELCQEMPRHFDTEDGRLSEFVRIVTRLFKGTGSFSRQFPVGSGRADLVLQCTPVGPVLVGEGKNEPGGSCGDPYMQVAASYDAWAREVDEKLQIDTCCPRIYGAFIGLDSRESVPLQFIKPFKNPWHGRRGVFDLLFRASVKEKIGDDLPAKESSVLVKVPIGSTYGLEPHVLAASAGFAPRLLGTASVPGAPVIYVMELLSESEEWFHLVWYELPKHITERQKGHLRDRGTALTSFLSRNQLVHGDLRGCNVMCRLGDNDVDLRVLDWDWAGKQGAARYPVALNMEAGYQGRPGGLIEASHDEHMLRKTLDDLFVR
ncbi:hypothetical protein FRC04_004173 [Tulasnella sp. 424]|nr:hypothetical protein FRC04_004173 [Tulasnella sp. 424]